MSKAVNLILSGISCHVWFHSVFCNVLLAMFTLTFAFILSIFNKKIFLNCRNPFQGPSPLVKAIRPRPRRWRMDQLKRPLLQKTTMVVKQSRFQDEVQSMSVIQSQQSDIQMAKSNEQRTTLVPTWEASSLAFMISAIAKKSPAWTRTRSPWWTDFSVKPFYVLLAEWNIYLSKVLPP